MERAVARAQLQKKSRGGCEGDEREPIWHKYATVKISFEMSCFSFFFFFFSWNFKGLAEHHTGFGVLRKPETFYDKTEQLDHVEMNLDRFFCLTSQVFSHWIVLVTYFKLN